MQSTGRFIKFNAKIKLFEKGPPFWSGLTYNPELNSADNFSYRHQWHFFIRHLLPFHNNLRRLVYDVRQTSMRSVTKILSRRM